MEPNPQFSVFTETKNVVFIGKQSYDNATEASDSTWQINAKVLLAEALQKSDQKDAAKECFSEALDLAKFHADKAAEQAIEKALSELNL